LLESPKIDIKNFEIEMSERENKPSFWSRILGIILISDAYAQGISMKSKKPVKISWPGVEGASGYIFEVSKSKDFKRIVESKKISKPQLLFKTTQLGPGKYFWRVTALEPGGKPGEPSEPGVFKIKMAPPDLNVTSLNSVYTKRVKKVKDLDTPHTHSLRWKETKYAMGYHLQVSLSEDFSEAVDYRPQGNRQEVLFKHPDKYYWRVRVLGQNGKPLGRYSSPGLFNYKTLLDQRKISSKGLVITQPGREKFYTTGGVAKIKLKWNKVPGAKSYQLMISKNSKFAEPLKRFSLTANSKTIKMRPNTDYFVKVRSIGSEDFSALEDTSRSLASIDRGDKVSKTKAIHVKDKEPLSISVGLGLHTLSIKQTSTASVDARLRTGEGKGSSFSAVSIKMDKWFKDGSSWLGMKANIDYSSTAIDYKPNQLTSSEVKVSETHGELLVVARKRLRPGLILTGGAGFRYLTRAYIEVINDQPTVNTLGNLFSAQHIAIRWTPDYGRRLFEFGFDTSQLINSPFKTRSFGYHLEGRQRFNKKWWIGLDLKVLTQALTITPEGGGSEEVEVDQTGRSLLFRIGMGF